MATKKSRKTTYIVIFIIIFMLALAYNNKNRNQSFDGAGMFVSTSHKKNVKLKERKDDSVPSILRWLNPFD